MISPSHYPPIAGFSFKLIFPARLLTLSVCSEIGYLAPNDDAENDRMDMHHHLSALLIGGGLLTAPIGKSPQRILGMFRDIPILSFSRRREKVFSKSLLRFRGDG